MLVEQLSIAYRCHCAIGNSVNLKEMVQEVLKTFVSETYAVYGHFSLINEENILQKFHSFGKINNFNCKYYSSYTDKLSIIKEKDRSILKISLDNGALFLITKELEFDCSFFISMFESLVAKLNLSVNACLNYKKIEESNYLLNEQKEKLIKANKIKDDFLANMSHELKTPLNSISIISTIMSENKNNKLDELTVKNATIIKKCAKDLTELINDILDISKIEAGELAIYKKDISLKNLIDETYDLFYPIAKNKKIKLINNFQIENHNIYSDENRIKQIIKNLLSNAIKFTNEGSVEILSKEFDDYYEINIIDSGIGIHKNDLDYVFDRFKQIDNKKTKKAEGTGLGLTISKELASLLNADLFVTSEISQGSTFKFVIFKEIDFEVNKDIKKENEKIDVECAEQIALPFILPSDNLFIKDIYLFHSNSIEQFNLTIKLKKHGFNIKPILNEEKFKEKIKSTKDKNYIFIIDTKLTNFKSIIKEKDLNNLNLVILEENETIENLIKNLTNMQQFTQGIVK